MIQNTEEMKCLVCGEPVELKSLHIHSSKYGAVVVRNECAPTELESLRAENARYREVLEKIMTIGTTSQGNTAECEIAYQALEGGKL